MTKSCCENKKQGIQPERVITLDDGTQIPVYQDTFLLRMIKILPLGGNDEGKKRLNSN